MAHRYPLGLQPVYTPAAIIDDTVDPPVPTDAVLKLTVRKPDGTLQDYTSPAHTGVGLYHQVIPTTDMPQLGQYRWLWIATGAGQGATNPSGRFEIFDPFGLDAFATHEDVADRWRPLTAAEAVLADTLCWDASALLRARFPGIDASIAAGTPSADVVMMVCAGMVRRALIAPSDGVSQQSETAGPFSQSQSYSNPMRNVFLTAADETLILGYRPKAMSVGYSNTTTRVENSGPAYVYGWF